MCNVYKAVGGTETNWFGRDTPRVQSLGREGQAGPLPRDASFPGTLCALLPRLR